MSVNQSLDMEDTNWRSQAARLCASVRELLEQAVAESRANVPSPDDCNPDALASLQNFAAYLAVRRRDIRELQRDLHRLGLSSLGRLETHVLDSLVSVAAILADLAGQIGPTLGVPRLTYDAGEQILARRTEQLLGPRSGRHTPRIMVTLPAEAATQYELVRDWIDAGMQVARINCAHDAPDTWAAMMQHVHRAAAEQGRSCAVLCDLPGPKLRTGPIETGPGVIRWHAFKDPYGSIESTARVWLTTHVPPPDFAHATLPVNEAFLAQLQAGDEVHFRDHQGRSRWLLITALDKGGVWAEGARGVFLVAGIPLVAERQGVSLPQSGHVGTIPPLSRELALKVGDALLLTTPHRLGHPRRIDDRAATIAEAQIPCSLPEVFRDVAVGERVFLDDGKIAGVIEAVEPEQLRVRIQWTRAATARLAEDKGINLPDSALSLPSLTPDDFVALDFVAQHAQQIDAVGLSFVRDAEDVETLYHELQKRDVGHLGVVLKIETASAFQHLPAIIQTALRRHRVGLMIARGDLGVEVGFDRMAELQEEIGSLCAAAHLPVIWATQVLETLTKKGMPSRAEVSDVVLAARTQCVMLNKGPHLTEAIRFLIDVLERMEGHQDKQLRLLRALRVAASPPEEQPA